MSEQQIMLIFGAIILAMCGIANRVALYWWMRREIFILSRVCRGNTFNAARRSWYWEVLRETTVLHFPELGKTGALLRPRNMSDVIVPTATAVARAADLKSNADIRKFLKQEFHESASVTANRKCGKCGIPCAPFGVDWPYWIDGSPACLACAATEQQRKRGLQS